MPKVLNKHTDHIPPGAVYVGRPSKWGNPWRIGERHPADGHRLTRDEVVAMHHRALSEMLTTRDEEGNIILDIEELRGKDLVCWCAPLSCHADVLLKVANEPTS